MAQRKTLNEVQVAVLRWINDACPDGVMADSVSARISTAALRNRGLVRTSGHGPTWKATITAAGTEYLQRLDGPNPPLPRQPNISVTQQLVDEVTAAGGSLRVPRKRWHDKDAVDYERRARLAQSHGKVPPGSRLVVRNASADELIIELVTDRMVEGNGGDTAQVLAPIAVPARLSKYHRVAREFRGRTSLHEVSRKALPRVLRIVHALALEAERRGYEVGCVQVSEDGYGRSDWRPARDGQLVFTINGHQSKVRIWEKGAGQRGPYEHQLNRWKHDREQPFRVIRVAARRHGLRGPSARHQVRQREDPRVSAHSAP